MKVRMGFVSNSSSTSFCVIGISNDEILEQLADADNIKIDALCGSRLGRVLMWYGSEGYVSVAGIDAEDVLKKKTIPSACKYVKELIKKELHIDVDISQIGFHYGEVSS